MIALESLERLLVAGGVIFLFSMKAKNRERCFLYLDVQSVLMKSLYEIFQHKIKLYLLGKSTLEPKMHQPCVDYVPQSDFR